MFPCSIEPVIVCSVSYSNYHELFPQKLVMIEKYLQLLSTVEIFADLPEENRILLLKDAVELNLNKRERLYEPGSLVRGIYLILEGMLRETIEQEEKKRGDVIPESLIRIKDFQVYVESYEVLRENELVRTETRVTYRTGDIIGLTEVFSGSRERTSLVRSVGPCKLLFFELSSLRRYGGLQSSMKQRLFNQRRRMKMQSTRRKTLESRPIHQTVDTADVQFRRLLYAKHMHW